MGEKSRRGEVGIAQTRRMTFRTKLSGFLYGRNCAGSRRRLLNRRMRPRLFFRIGPPLRPRLEGEDEA